MAEADPRQGISLIPVPEKKGGLVLANDKRYYLDPAEVRLLSVVWNAERQSLPLEKVVL